MDAKSAAKSKRAHSLHNKPKKPHPAPATSSSVAGKQKAAPPTSHRRAPPSLPNNWDRYDDEVAEEGGDGDGLDRDAIMPRSKGADFRFLISEAENELRNRPAGGREEAVAFDFDLGLGTIFHSYGKNLTSLNSDDNFIVNDHASSNYATDFLSIDLDALADCLAKLDPHERLFIEEDRLPEELRKVHVSSSPGKDVQEDTRTGAELGISKMEVFNNSTEVASSSTYVETILVGATSKLAITEQVPTVEDSVITNETNDRDVGDYPKQSVGFEARAAEAELDSLLDSLGETQFSESILTIGKPSHNFLGDAPIKDDEFFSKNTAVSSIDVSVDDLLNEVSHVQQPRPASFSKHKSSGSLNSSSTASKTLDDFDSWLDGI